jgi:hypothetical protein
MEHPVTERLFLGRITPGMDVCDVTGEKVGTISHLHRLSNADTATMDTATAAEHPLDEIMEIKTGFLGLGKHYYVPVSAVQEVLTDSVFLSMARDSFEGRGYETKPASLVGIS